MKLTISIIATEDPEHMEKITLRQKLEGEYKMRNKLIGAFEEMDRILQERFGTSYHNKNQMSLETFREEEA